MSGFSLDWLGLRAPLDSAARADALVTRLRDMAPDGERHIVDLATGSGANLRYLAPRLGGRQCWRLVDHDAALLAAIPDCVRHWAAALGLDVEDGADDLLLRGPDLHCRIHCQRLDLASGLAALDLGGCWLLTASALLDLVSAPWLQELLARAGASACTLLLTLSYDGQVAMRPALPDDEWLTGLVNRHQRGDKGFGAALGPRAAALAADLARHQGYAVLEAPSPWRISPAHGAVQRALFDGWAEAAGAVAPGEGARIAAWQTARVALLEAGHSSVRVGHRDLLAWPAADRAR